jgi:MFS family permease
MRLGHTVKRTHKQITGWLETPASQEDRNIRNLYIDTAWQGIWSAGTGTFLAVYLARIGTSSFLLGALTALPALLTILVTMPAGAFVERQRDHVRVTTIYRILFRSTYLVLPILPFFLSDAVIPPVVVVLWAVQAIPAAVVAVSWTSVVAGAIPARRRPAVNGGRWALVSCITAIFVAIFGRLLDSDWLPFPFNYQVIFFISFIAQAISIFYFHKIVMPMAHTVTPVVRRTIRERVANLFAPITQTPEFMKYLSGTFLVRLGISLPVALYSIFWVRELSASDTVIGLRTTVAQAALVLGYMLFGRLAARRGHRNILLVSSAGLALYPVVTALSLTPGWLLPAAAIWGFFSGGIDISFFEGLLETTPADKRPSFAALNQVVANIAVFFGPLLGAILEGWLGIRVAFYVAAVLHLAGAGLCWYMGVGLAKAPDAEPPAVQS